MGATVSMWTPTDRADGWTVCLRWDDGTPELIDGVSVQEPGNVDPNTLRASDYESRAIAILLAYGVDLEIRTLDTRDGNVRVGESGETIYSLRATEET